MTTEIKILLKANRHDGIPTEVTYIHDPSKKYQWNFITRALAAGGPDVEVGILDLSENMTSALFNLMLKWQSISNDASVQESEMYWCLNSYGCSFLRIINKRQMQWGGKFHDTTFDDYFLYRKLYDLPDFSHVVIRSYFKSDICTPIRDLNIMHEIMGEDILAKHIKACPRMYYDKVMFLLGKESDFEVIINAVCFNPDTPTETNKVFDSIIFVFVERIRYGTGKFSTMFEPIISLATQLKKLNIKSALDKIVDMHGEMSLVISNILGN